MLTEDDDLKCESMVGGKLLFIRNCKESAKTSAVSEKPGTSCSVFISQAQHYRINGITCATCTSQLCQPCNAKTIFSSISDDGDIVDFQFENGERDQLSDEPPCQPFFRTPKTINSKPKYNDRTKDAVVEPIELPPFTLTVKVYIFTANYTHHC